jgi:4-aminobutyrate aminotransferase
LDVLEREGVENSRKVGAHMLDRIKDWPNKLPLVGDIRGRGLMIAVEIVADKAKKTPSGDLRDRIVDLAFERGILFLGAGPNSVRISPPLVVTEEQADIALDILEECIQIAAKDQPKQSSQGQPVGA